MTASALSTRGLDKSFGSLVVARDIELDLPPGERYALIGPNGAGKTTLINLITGMLKPDNGRILLGADEITALEPEQRVKRGLVRTFQINTLFKGLSVLENVLIPTLVAKEGRHRERARQLLDQVGLSERIGHLPAQLSGGEKQRVAIARALIREPLLLLADEPTGNLDRKTAHAVGELLLDMHRQEPTILIVVTHSIELARLLPKQLEMNDGRLEPWNGGAA